MQIFLMSIHHFGNRKLLKAICMCFFIFVLHGSCYLVLRNLILPIFEMK